MWPGVVPRPHPGGRDFTSRPPMPPNPNWAIARSTRSALASLGRIKKSMSAEYRGNPCHDKASAPTIRYSTSFEFKHSINSRKPLLKGIGVSSLSQLEENVDPLLRSHLPAGQGVGRISFFEAVKNTGHFLHSLILRHPRSSTIRFRVPEVTRAGLPPASGAPSWTCFDLWRQTRRLESCHQQRQPDGVSQHLPREGVDRPGRR